MRGSIIDTVTLNSTNRDMTQAPSVETHKPVMMMKSMRNWRTRVETCWSGFSQGTNNGSILSKACIGHIHLADHLFLSGFVAFAFWWEDLHHVFFFEIAHNFVKRRGDKWLAFRKPLGGVGPAKWAREDIFHQNRPTNQPMPSSNIGFCGQKLSLAIPSFIMDTFYHFDEQF